MEAIAIDFRRGELFQTTGCVVEVKDGKFAVETDEGLLWAARAVSCLVAPETNDLVALMGGQAEALFVVAVLDRSSSSDARIAPDGNLTFDLRAGHFSVQASEGVNLVSSARVAVAARKVEVRSRQGEFVIDTIRVVGNAVDSLLDRLSQKVRVSLRHVEEVDLVRAGQIDYSSRGLTRLHGEDVAMTASGLVKAQGSQIHLG